MKRRRICTPDSRFYASKNKEELKALCRSKKLKVSGLRDELLDRLEKADRGQTELLFHISVPQVQVHPHISTVELPTTPQKRRHRVEEDEEEDEEFRQPSQKEAKRGLRKIEDEGGGEETTMIKLLRLGGKGDPIAEEGGPLCSGRKITTEEEMMSQEAILPFGDNKEGQGSTSRN